MTANVTASVTVQSLAGDGCDGCDGLIELNNRKKEKKLVEEKNKEKFFLATEKELLVLPSHPSQSKPQTNMNQEVQGIIKPSQISSQSITSITDGGGGRFDPIQETGIRYWYKLTTQHRWKSFNDIVPTFPTADRVKNFVVFNIGGNNFRLITYF